MEISQAGTVSWKCMGILIHKPYAVSGGQYSVDVRLTKRYWLVVAFIFALLQSPAQQKYWVYFTDKDTTGFNPYLFFDAKAIQRHLNAGNVIIDTSDIPVNKKYLSQLTGHVKSIGYESRWLNAVSVEADKRELLEIQQLYFVKKVVPMQYLKVVPAYKEVSDSFSSDDKFVYDTQLSILEGDEFIRRGINGKGIRIAIFDGGFSGADKSPVLKHLFDHNQIIKTYDFRKKNEFVYAYMTHGTKVLSCIAGVYNNLPLGLAPGAEFLLARTEIKPERHVEEEYWLAAVEWAEKNGADIISSSLGYTAKLYPIEAMDGKTSIVSKAAKLAFSKGMLVINAMGNDGDRKWEIMGTPADAGCVLSVGGINPYSGFHIFFSSYGPTKDLRMKPNVCAPAVVMTASKKSIGMAYGTSFSTPLVSGFAACVWQLDRAKNNIEIFDLIQKSGHLYPYFDYAHGYGIPQASFFFKKEKENFSEDPFKIVTAADSLKVIVTDLNVRKANPFDFLYFHIQTPDGRLRYYAVVKVSKPETLQIDLHTIMPGEKVRIYYKHCVKEFSR
jgi:serine protease AprX